MEKHSLTGRLQELGIYNDFYMRRELKPLASVLKDSEQINCIITGVNEGNRKLVAITDQRVIIIFSGALASGEIKVINANAVASYGFTKKLLQSSAVIRTSKEEFCFTGTQRSLCDLFNWAMEKIISNKGK
ncbi:MAG: hypothetical protein Q4E54_00110 [Lachnospiraceae bacterium]|nr:hypothetical protein [Lachnospiraceae bacterium]